MAMDGSENPPRQNGDAGTRLTLRQLECLRLAAKGLTSTQIATTLGISARTVNQYFAEACVRLGVRNRIQAVAKAVALGLLRDVP